MPLSKAERLVIAGAIAPTLREGLPKRRVKVVAKDGSILREIDATELVQRVLEHAKIELDVEPDPSRCATCNAPAEVRSARDARKRGTKAYCNSHKKTRREKPLLPCSVCGITTAKRATVRYAKRPVFCEEHKGGTRRKRSRLPCSVCGNPATSNSTGWAVRNGGKAFCEDHKKGSRPVQCSLCGKPATKRSSGNANRLGFRPYCEACSPRYRSKHSPARSTARKACATARSR